MRHFCDYVIGRDALREGLYDGWIPFDLDRPSGKVTSCRAYTRRLIRKFKPRITRTAPVAVQRPRVQPMRWGPVR